MNIEQVGLQLGIAGLVLVIGYRLAILLIKGWREAEKERTEVLADNFGQMTSSIQRLGEGQARVEGKLDNVLSQRETGPIRLIRSDNGKADR